ncbi:ATP-binding cassette domain-containing protein [Undibacterium rugosum]|uniref:ATP-binding cassette domain-containing protein n=1 Tax=Undibacterium rugosum TaxID=2762291 RepID=UPI001B833D13|nr:ATP-binding cassette domain-containing protein [Undibacterium rugosum]MBR7779125.1 ATP-binding cassette domain-containing protein [Undibacterium rugosum]
MRFSAELTSQTTLEIASLRQLLNPLQLDDADVAQHIGTPVSAEPPAGNTGCTIDLQHVTKSFGPQAILQDLNLQIAAGEFVAVIGRSGCGKSTLLRVIAGLEQIDSGSLQFAQGKQQPAIRVMFQDARLLPWKTVQQNVALGLEQDAAQASQLLAQVALADRAGDWPSVLSGGQRQRVALARALVHQPAVLLLDEPLGALDALTRIEMQNLIEQLWLQRGLTAVLVTHDVQEAVTLADRVILIEDGQVALDQQIDLPRPRQRGDARFAALEAAILQRVLHGNAPQAQTAAGPVAGPVANQPAPDAAALPTVTDLAWAV